MSYLVDFFKLIGSGIHRAFSFIISVPGQVVTLFTTLGTSLYEGFVFLSGNSSEVTGIADTVQNFAREVADSSFVQSDWFQTLGYTLALDDAWTYITGAFSFFCAGCIFLLTVVLPFLFTFGFSVMVVNTTRNMVNSFLPGAAKF